MSGLSRTALERLRTVIGAELDSELQPALGEVRETFGPPLADGIPRYSLFTELGQGGMGTVWLAFDRSLQRFVALKMLHAWRSAHTERFLREARFLSRLRHPGIVVVHDLGAVGGLPYFTMEHVQGVSLDRLEGLDARRACEIARDVAFAVHHAHGAGILHRDLKPSNILVRTDGSALVLDFGIARVIEDEHRLTAPGQLLGTFFYMAPEQASGQALTPRTDVYGLGATLYELVTGARLFDATDKREALLKVGRERPRRPRDIVPGIPREVETLILRALEIDPAARFGSMREFAEALECWLGPGESVPPSPEAPAPAPAWRPGFWPRNRSKILFACAAVVTATLALLSALEGPNDGPSDHPGGEPSAADSLVAARSRLREAKGIASSSERELREKLLEEARSLASSSDSDNEKDSRDRVLAEIEFEGGALDSCLRLLERARKLDPASLELQVLALRARLRLLLTDFPYFQGRYDGLTAHFQDPALLSELEAWPNGTPLDSLVRGLLAILASNLAPESIGEGLSILRQSDFRRAPEARVVAGLFLLLAGDGEKALVELGTGATLDPWFAPAWVYLGWASLIWGREDARQCLDQALVASDRPGVSGRRLWAALDFKDGRYLAARNQLESLLAGGETAPEIVCDLGTVALASGDPELACRRFEECLGGMPGDFRPLYLLACALAEIGRPRDALGRLEAAVREARSKGLFLRAQEGLDLHLLLSDMFYALVAERVTNEPRLESVRHEPEYRQRIEPLLKD